MKSDSGRSLFLVLAVTVLIAAALTGAAYWAGLILPGPFALDINSSPAGALVLFDGKPAGMTPLVLGDVKPGGHSFTFTMDGYRDQKVAKVFVVGEAVNAVLEPLPSGRISVVTEPDRAMVFVDGVEKGETPLSFISTPGVHNLSIVKENFDEVVTTLEVENGKEMPFQVKLTPSMETYYKRMIALEPKNMGNYCDLMRFYYVKHRFADLAALAMTGYSIISENNLMRDDGSQRFNQEMEKIRTDDRELYKKEILPQLVPVVIDYVAKHPDRGGEALFSLLMNRERPGEGWGIIVKMLIDSPNTVALRLVIAQQAPLAYPFFKGMSDADFRKLADTMYDSDKLITEKSQLFSLYSGFGNVAYAGVKKYDIACKFYRKAIEVFPEKGDIRELNAVQLTLVRSMGSMKNYTEALAYIEELLKDPRTSTTARSVLVRERSSVEAKMKPGATPAPTPSPKKKLK